MKCNDVKPELLDLATGSKASPTVEEHLRTCSACAAELVSMQKTMALLDEWQAPAEASPYFMTRLHARMREEQKRPANAWLDWFRRPVLAVSMAVLMVIGVGLFYVGAQKPQPTAPPVTAQVGSPVSDLQLLDKDHDLMNDDLLDVLSPDQSQDDSQLQ